MAKFSVKNKTHICYLLSVNLTTHKYVFELTSAKKKKNYPTKITAFTVLGTDVI